MATKHFAVRLKTSARSFGLLSLGAPEVGVIFVHGFLGNPSGTWVDFEHMVDVNLGKGFWQKCDLFFYGYVSRNQVRPLAEVFLEFLKFVAARNEGPLIKTDLPLPSMTQNAPAIPKELMSGRGSAKYKHIILVGHSTGAVIIRQAILLHLRRLQQDIPDLTAWTDDLRPPTSPEFNDQIIARASLRFFAPAHLGVLAAGKLGFARSVPIVRQIIDAYLRCNPLYQTLKDGSQTLRDIRRDTEDLYRDYKLEALKASSLFGEHEEIVVVGGYDHDEDPPTEPGQNHTSVCKPHHSYLTPLEFVADGRTLAKRA
jgi:pimeloyl-ACP methyl ester carboxylesterase